MFALKRPNERLIRSFLQRARTSTLTYSPEGLSMQSPAGYKVDELRMKIGQGAEDFARAQRALDSWQPLRVGWTEAYATESSPVVGCDVAVVARHIGLWSINACRVVKRFPDSAGDTRYGFAYGTLADHAERGEELFLIELDRSDGTVWYQIRAVSKPRALLARLGYPVSRLLQKRFRLGSFRAMAAAAQARD